MVGQGVADALERIARGEVVAAGLLEGAFDDRFGSGSLGLVWDELSRERVTAHLVADERHHQPTGIVHGGVWCSMVESLASVGAVLNVVDGGRTAVGVHNSTDFLRSHRTGRVDGTATPLQVGRTQQLWQVVLVRAEDGSTIARGQVRLANVDRDGRAG